MTTAAGAPLDAAARAAIQRQTLRVLTAGQVVGAAALSAAVTVGAFVIQSMLGQNTPWAGLATATVTTGTAFMSQILSRLMQRRGRRVGMQRGYGLAVVGGVLAACAVELDWLPLFLAGLFLYGNGQAANLLARYTATDLAEPDERSRAMSRVVFASTFGAVLGPLLIGPAERAGQSWFGFEKYTGPWVFGSVIFTAAMVNTAVRLRPDPLHVAAASAGISDSVPRARTADAVNAIRRSPGARLALAAMVVSHATMVAVMTMTPVHLKLHGHEGVSTIVVSTHIAGMYAFSPLVGRFSDRRGRLPTIVVGSLLLIGATTLAALSGDVEQLLFPALWTLGLGWNFGLIGGSSLLVDSVHPAERVAVQGTADLSMSLCGGIAGFSSGFIRRAVGFHMLANVATAAAGLLFIVAYLAQRRHIADTATKDRRRGAFTRA
jgi:MFS family permease